MVPTEEAPIVNMENSQEAEASEVVLIFLPEEEGKDQTMKAGKDQTMREIEVATKATLEGSLEVAEAGLMLLVSTTKIESNVHPEDSKGKMKLVAKFNKDPSEAVGATEVVISKTEEAVECTPEEAASEAIALKAMRTEAEEAASVVIEEASVVIEAASVVIEAASVVIEVASVVAMTEKSSVVKEVATVVAMMEKSSVAKEVATVVAMTEMRVEEDMNVLAPLPPSLLPPPEVEANQPITER